MKKTQIWAWYISTFFKKHKRLMVAGILLGILISVCFIWLLPIIPRPVKTNRIGLIGQYNKNQLPLTIRNKVSQGLTATMEDGSVAPLLAEKWDVSDNGQEYTFYLRDNLYWQDGTALTTKDLEYNFSDLDIEKNDDKTILFRLTSGKSFAPFPVLLTTPIFKKNLIGTGDYVIKQVKENGGIVKSVNIEKNDEKIIYKIYPTLSMAKMAFLMGEIDVIQNISTNPFEYETEWQQTTDIISKQENNIHIGLFFNLENDLFKDNKALRQALAYATRKPKDESRATGPIARTSWAYNLDVKIYDFEPKRANELAEKSLGNIEKVRAMQLKISTTNSLLSLAEEIKRDWEEVFGCNVEIEVINTIQPDYQILLTAQEIPEDPDQYALWHSTQSWPGNIINLKNLRIDKLLEDGRTEIDTKVRKDYYFEFQKYFVEEVPVLFLYYPNYYTIVRKNTVKNVLIDILQKGRRMSQSVETTE